MTPEQHDKMVKPFELKDNVQVEGITADYVWYNTQILTQKMQSWQRDFEKLAKTMEDRHNEHLHMIGDLLRQNKVLKDKLKEQAK
jgi:hypothetical protein